MSASLLSNGAYTRTNGSPQAGRDSTFPRFHMHPVEDAAATASAGRPIFAQQERVQIIQPGSPNSPVLYVTDEHRQRWPEQYSAFKRGEEAVADGMPIEQWPVLNRTQVLEMKAIGLHSVEQCAGLSDLAIQKIGMGGHRIRELAKAYLDEADQMAITTKALADRDAANARVASLEAQIAEMRPMLDRLHSDMMAVRNAPNAIESYVPGDHDPMQAHNKAQFAGPVAGSSLDALGDIKRRPGRPAKAA